MLRPSMFALALLCIPGCSDAADGNKPAGVEQSQPVAADVLEKPAGESKTGETSIKAQFTQVFTAVIMQEAAPKSFSVAAGAPTSFGMSCTPSTVSNSNQEFEIVLPEQKEARAHVFAVMTPGGKLYELYSPYGDDVESEDIIVPSDAVSWAAARNQNRFALRVDDISGIQMGRDDPFGIFVEEGAYRFALVSSISKDLIEVNKAEPPVTVYAGCVINFSNQT